MTGEGVLEENGRERKGCRETLLQACLSTRLLVPRLLNNLEVFQDLADDD